MIEPQGGQWSQVVACAAAEARRLRLQRNCGDVTSAALDAKPPERLVPPLPVDRTDDGVVVEWQLEQRPGGPGMPVGPSDVDPVPLDRGTFDVATNFVDGQVLLQISGELDCATAAQLRQAMDDLRGRTIATLVLDLARLTFIDSSGLHEIVVAFKRQREAGGELVIRDPNPSTRRVLDIVGLSQVLAVE